MAHRRFSGMILIELLMASLAALVLGTALLAMIQADVMGVSTVQGQSIADAQARQPLDILADNIRAAYPYGSTTPSCLEAASSNSIYCYTDASGDYVRYWLDTTVSPAALKKTVGTTTTVLISGVQSLQFTYYVSGGAYTPVSGSWVTTASPNAPTSGELPNIAAVKITATVTLNGYTRQLSTTVRLRNSPASASTWG